MEENNNSSQVLNKILVFYVVGFLFTTIGHMAFKVNSHTAPLSFLFIILFIVIGLVWMIRDYLNYKPRKAIYIHLTCLVIYAFLIALIA